MISTDLTQFWYLCELFYVIANCLLKFAIGYFYLRVAIERWHIWAIKLLMLGTVLCGLIYFFLVMLQCLPSKYLPGICPLRLLMI
jgi:4-amino-4-deoxy-L-arabinose transferase-like glycosyltransferase